MNQILFCEDPERAIQYAVQLCDVCADTSSQLISTETHES